MHVPLPAQLLTFHHYSHIMPQDKINNVQQQIFKKNEKLEEYKSLIKWNQEELDQWAEAQKQKEDDNAQFVKFTKADQVKIRELEVSIERLTQQVRPRAVSCIGGQWRCIPAARHLGNSDSA